MPEKWKQSTILTVKNYPINLINKYLINKSKLINERKDDLLIYYNIIMFTNIL